MSTSEGAEGLGPMARAVVWRPWLWPAALSAALRLARPGWWHRWPPLPAPDADLWRFRMESVYGGTGDAAPSRSDVRSFLHWYRTVERSEHH